MNPEPIEVQQTGEAEPGDPGETIRIRAFILLAGSVRKTEFLSAVNRSVLDLPLKDNRNLGDYWLYRLGGAIEGLSQDSLSVLVVTDETTPRPALKYQVPGLEVRVVVDPVEYRGTAGVLADLCRDFDPDEYVLVANASQPPYGPLGNLIGELTAARGDARVLIASDRSPTGLTLMRCGCLDVVPDVGFCDLKEQALPQIAERNRVSVVPTDVRFPEPIRTRRSYLDAVKAFAEGLDAPPNPFAEESHTAFALVMEGARVGAGARIHDSVLFSGCEVGDGAVIARSVVCPGAMVRKGESAVDRTVASPGRSGR